MGGLDPSTPLDPPMLYVIQAHVRIDKIKHNQSMKHAYFASKICNVIFASFVFHSLFEIESRKIEHLNKRSKEIMRNKNKQIGLLPDLTSQLWFLIT